MEKNNLEELIKEILDQFDHLDYIHSSQIPDIDLYMDQVTTFMEDRLDHTRRYPDDKILTKTMINNYAKNHLLPPPDRKKYSKEHLMIMTLIYYCKEVLPLQDIQALLRPLEEKYFHAESGLQLTEIYDKIFSAALDRQKFIRDDVCSMEHSAREAFPEAPEDDREFLQLFALICFLTLDVYLKKKVIEQLIDSMSEDQMEESPKDRKKKEAHTKKGD